MGASDKSDRVLSPSATEPEVSAHSGDAPLRVCECFARNPFECACGAWDDADLSLWDDDL